MDAVQMVQNARPWGEVLISLAQTVGTQVVIIFLIDRAAKLIEQAMRRRDMLDQLSSGQDLFGPKPLQLSRLVASSVGDRTTPPQEASTGSSSLSGT
jgi:hypothetical protein